MSRLNKSLRSGRCFITGKVRHRSEGAATREKHRLIAKGEDAATIHIYACDCGAWHVGRLSPRDQKRNAISAEKWRKIREQRTPLGEPRP
jgi:hypothetical protein